MTILVVGGAGYIGAHTARALKRRGHKVVIYDNLYGGHKEMVNDFDLIVGEIADSTRLKFALKNVDAVMHFAAHAYVGESVKDPQKYFQNNIVAALSLLDTVIQCGIRVFVFSSTCAVYGVPEHIPIVESTPRNPINPYGSSKLFFEYALSAYERAYDLRYACLRYFNAAGADESGEIGELHNPETHLIPLALVATDGGAPLQIFGSDYPTPDGSCIRDYIHVNDLAEAHSLAAQKLVLGSDSFTANLGTGKGHSIYEVLAAVERVTHKKVPYEIKPRRQGDPPILIADSSRAQELLQWRATRNLNDIVETAWKWMQRAVLVDTKY